MNNKNVTYLRLLSDKCYHFLSLLRTFLSHTGHCSVLPLLKTDFSSSYFRIYREMRRNFINTTIQIIGPPCNIIAKALHHGANGRGFDFRSGIASMVLIQHRNEQVDELFEYWGEIATSNLNNQNLLLGFGGLIHTSLWKDACLYMGWSVRW